MPGIRISVNNVFLIACVFALGGIFLFTASVSAPDIDTGWRVIGMGGGALMVATAWRDLRRPFRAPWTGSPR